ncbi:MAG: HindIII family type II restriction endonuclease [Verrucomicrobiaceae bacterium]|nr:HindIII family type II restriction endonuclease [Verrucomicrobiaceae bacterium]
MDFITKDTIKHRAFWIEEIRKLSGDFGEDSSRLEKELIEEISRDGLKSLVGHLRLCGAIPESYGHDSSEEKLYSKYTDSLLAESFNSLGIRSLVLKERADSADVECAAQDFSFVADAKAFRLSRTAKNQKDFKVQAMHTWKRGKPYALVVCPLYQLPAKTSQIYQQAVTLDVCILSYAHLVVLLRLESAAPKKRNGEKLLHRVFKTVGSLHPSKDAQGYWQAVNRAFLEFSTAAQPLWVDEKRAAIEAMQVVKDEALTYLAREREKFLRMSHREAIQELIRAHRIDSRMQTIREISVNLIFDLGA